MNDCKICYEFSIAQHWIISLEISNIPTIINGMDYTSDSDVSDGTRELVRQGLASVRRKRASAASQPDHVYGRLPVPDTDNYNIRHPDGINGAASIHGLNILAKEIVNGQNRNISIE